jgi:hypothetical protein
MMIPLNFASWGTPVQQSTTPDRRVGPTRTRLTYATGTRSTYSTTI